MPIRHAVKVGLAIGAALAWVGTVTLLISHEPAPGAASPRELREQLASALAAHDADALAQLVNYPGSGAGDFTKDYVSVLNDNKVHDLAVRLVPDEITPHVATVTGVLGDGKPFGYTLAVTSEDGRWTVALTPPLP